MTFTVFHKRNICLDISVWKPQTSKETDRKLSSGQGKTHSSPNDEIFFGFSKPNRKTSAEGRHRTAAWMADVCCVNICHHCRLFYGFWFYGQIRTRTPMKPSNSAVNVNKGTHIALLVRSNEFQKFISLLSVWLTLAVLVYTSLTGSAV